MFTAHPRRFLYLVVILAAPLCLLAILNAYNSTAVGLGLLAAVAFVLAPWRT